MDNENVSRPRPYWHVDAKWVVALLWLVMASLSLLLFNLYQATAEERAVDTLSLALALAASETSLDDETEVEALRALLETAPEQEVQLVPGLNITVTAGEIADLSAREVRLLVMRKFATPIYEQGAQGLADLTTDPGLQQAILEGGGLLNLLTRQRHTQLETLLPWLAGVNALLLLILVIFSYRWGRLANPGCLLLVVGTPGLLLFGALSRSGVGNAAVERAAGALGLTRDILAQVLPPLAQHFLHPYILTTLVGLGLLGVAVVGGLIGVMRRA